jgi:hypothetical protein
MDHGPSRREHFGARGGSPPQVGCADRPHPRRLGAGHSDLRIGGETSSSDRVSAVPVNTMTVWPEPALQLAGDEPEPRAAKGAPPGESTARPHATLLREGCGGARRSTLRGAREWRADEHASGRERVRRAVSASRTRVTAEGCRARARTTGRRSSERAPGRERVSSEMRCDDVGDPHLRVWRPTRWDLLSGKIHWHPRRGPTWLRPRRLLRETPEPPRSRADRSFGNGPPPVARSQTGPKHPAFPRRSGRGTPTRFGPPGEMSSASWAAREKRGSHRNESIQSPREHRASAPRQRRAHRNGLLGGEKP